MSRKVLLSNRSPVTHTHTYGGGGGGGGTPTNTHYEISGNPWCATIDAKKNDVFILLCCHSITLVVFFFLFVRVHIKFAVFRFVLRVHADV